MSEYSFVEKPFLEQLKSLQWNVVEHPNGVPTDPAISLRESFRDVVLKEVFKQAIKHINKTEDGRAWLTDAQLEEVYTELIDHPHQNLLAATHSAIRAPAHRCDVHLRQLFCLFSPH